MIDAAHKGFEPGARFVRQGLNNIGRSATVEVAFSKSLRLFGREFK